MRIMILYKVVFKLAIEFAYQNIHFALLRRVEAEGSDIHRSIELVRVGRCKCFPRAGAIL